MGKKIKTILVEGEESPPLFKTWKGWYFAVLINLILLVLFFFIFTKVFE